jgi:protein-tyrosine kinase
LSKLLDALKKSETVDGRSSPEPAPRKVVNISPKALDALKLATSPTQGSTEESPLLQSRLDPRLASFLEPGSLAVESFKMLLAKILTRKSMSRPRTIMVTSPQPMDGKTMVATNLAISIAHGINEYVLLVDCDLRRPSLDRILGLNPHEGISEYLEKGTSVGPYLVKTPVGKLTVLPAGKPSPNPSELLSSEKTRRLVEELKGRYEDRYIIFDATPAQFAPEATFLASIVDGVLLVVRSGKTTRNSVLEAIENIDRNKIIGVVFNASTKSPEDYRYYYRYYRKGRR